MFCYVYKDIGEEDKEVKKSPSVEERAIILQIDEYCTNHIKKSHIEYITLYRYYIP
jgi:hypothetical protein